MSPTTTFNLYNLVVVVVLLVHGLHLAYPFHLPVLKLRRCLADAAEVRENLDALFVQLPLYAGHGSTIDCDRPAAHIFSRRPNPISNHAG